jgi:signal recognition particle receptor subunit beta
MFVKAPSGLKQLTGKFQRVMKIVFHGLDFVVIFVDDVSVVSCSLEDHAVHLVEVISFLTKAGLIINTSKSLIGCTSIYF